MADLQAQRRQAWLGGGGTKLRAAQRGPAQMRPGFRRPGWPGSSTRAYDDLYVTVAAGSSVAEVAAELAADGFILPLAAPWPDATIGGTIAAQFNAPWRGAYGGIRETLLCAEVVLPDGRVLRLGRPLVKDVAGYSLHKLFIGSFGTLARAPRSHCACIRRPPAHITWRVACPGLTAALAAARVPGPARRSGEHTAALPRARPGPIRRSARRSAWFAPTQGRPKTSPSRRPAASAAGRSEAPCAHPSGGHRPRPLGASPPPGKRGRGASGGHKSVQTDSGLSASPYSCAWALRRARCLPCWQPRMPRLSPSQWPT